MTPTSAFRAPNAHKIAVALGASDTIRISWIFEDRCPRIKIVRLSCRDILYGSIADCVTRTSIFRRYPYACSAGIAGGPGHAPKNCSARREAPQDLGSGDELPECSVEIKETYRRPGQGQTIVAYHVFVKGLPSSQNYNLLQMNVVTGQLTTSMQGVTFGKDGLAICAGRPGTCGDPNTPDDPIDFILPSEKGESHHLALVSEDGQSRVFSSSRRFLSSERTAPVPSSYLA